jgi:hypothetical protein
MCRHGTCLDSTAPAISSGSYVHLKEQKKPNNGSCYCRPQRPQIIVSKVAKEEKSNDLIFIAVHSWGDQQ